MPHEPWVVACGGDGCGAVTPDCERELVEPEREERWAWWPGVPEDPPDDAGEPSSVPEPPVVADPVVEPVWVAEAMPNEAPRAPTIPRPARPAWRRLLRWRGVMSSTLRRFPVANL